MDATTPQSSTASVQVRLALKGLEAWARLHPPVPVDPDVVRRALKEAGVFVGIDEDAVVELAEMAPKDEVLVARGEEPIPGEAARIEYLFSEDETFVPSVDEQSGKVDYREGNVVSTVDAGQVVARKIPAGDGIPGRTVTGEPIPATRGKDLHILGGKNVELSADKLFATSLVIGIPRIVKNRLSVLPMYMVEDVDFNTGNINFQGSVVVRGSVHPGFSVKATEDIVVEGTVEQAHLEAGGSIRVKGGVRSGSELTAVQDIQVFFCDSNAVLNAGNQIVVKGDALHSTLIANHRIIVGRHLIGGSARAGTLIQTLVAGSAAETATRVELAQGGSIEELEALRDEIAELEAEIKEITRKIAAEMARPGGGNHELQKLTPLKVNKNIELSQLRTRLKEMVEAESGEVDPHFVVKGDLHPGVTIHFATPKGVRSLRTSTKELNKVVRFTGEEIVF